MSHGSRAGRPHPTVGAATRLSADDLFYLNEGTHLELYRHLGAHLGEVEGAAGTYFAVWAPNAHSVAVVGDWNGWNPAAHPLKARSLSGVWEMFVPGVGKGALYKYHIVSRRHGYSVNKADPFGVFHESPPGTASIVWDLDYVWGDGPWMAERSERNGPEAPISIYELHLGSWMRQEEEGGRSLSYAEAAPRVAEHVRKLGFTHVEIMPIMEHPYDGSWGYQTTGYFAPTSRYGTPQEFMGFIDTLHREGIGVILDWVPSHFPSDEHGLAYFDGTHLYEHADPKKGFHPDWKSLIFNYGRNEVRSFLLSSALFWLDVYHADGLRVDAVASMLYLDYSREPGEWIPNKHGGRENLEAISFLQRMNEEAYGRHPDIMMIAEESTSWPMVSRPVYLGGLGFGFKWDMGWMHDTLDYMAYDPLFRKYHHERLTFRSLYLSTENFVLPLSHDEVVHEKSSLIGKMPGDEWQKFANLRLLYAYMWIQPGKKLLFMGAEMAQWEEWDYRGCLSWDLLAYPRHQGVSRLLAELNTLYRRYPALHQLDHSPAGFEWIDANDSEQSVITVLRKGHRAEDTVVVVLNFTPVPRYEYMVGVPRRGRWAEILNTDERHFGGSGHCNTAGLEARDRPHHARPFSVSLTVPPLGAVFLRPEGESA